MYTLNEQDKEFEQLNKKSKGLLNQMLELLKPEESDVVIPSDQPLYQSPEHRGQFFILREGMLSCMYKGRRLFFFDEGDLLGIEHLYADSVFALESEFAVVADRYQGEAFIRKAGADQAFGSLWGQYLACRLQMLTLLVGAFQPQETESSPRIRRYEKGQQIIRQADTGHEVYNLISGSADVYVDGVKVGEVFPDEIFGALAALTDTPRTASVKATADSMVIVLNADEFSELIAKRPVTALQLVKDMARTIVSLNEKVVGLGGKRE